MSINATVTLRNGLHMPIFGLGTWLSSNNGEAAAAVTLALDAGYRMIDTAQMYGNEADVGLAIRQWVEKNPTLPPPFVVTKLKGDGHEIGSVTRSLKRSLELLQMEAVDLFLIHSPKGMRCVDTWKEMLMCRDMGLTKAVGVSNFGIQQLEGLKNTGLELPEINQIETHVWNQQTETRAYMKENHITAMGYCPLARCKQFGESKLAELSTEKNVSEASLAIRWCIEQGVIVIPKSSNGDRIVQNASAIDIVLTQEDQRIMALCDCGFKAR